MNANKIDWRLVIEMALAALSLFLLAELIQARQNEQALSKQLDRYVIAAKGKP